MDIPNPLYSYRWQQFPLNSEAHYFPTDDGNKDCWYWNETKRLPNANGSDQYDAVNQSLADISSSLQDQVVSCQPAQQLERQLIPLKVPRIHVGKGLRDHGLHGGSEFFL